MAARPPAPAGSTTTTVGSDSASFHPAKRARLRLASESSRDGGDDSDGNIALGVRYGGPGRRGKETTSGHGQTPAEQGRALLALLRARDEDASTTGSVGSAGSASHPSGVAAGGGAYAAADSASAGQSASSASSAPASTLTSGSRSVAAALSSSSSSAGSAGASAGASASASSASARAQAMQQLLFLGRRCRGAAFAAQRAEWMAAVQARVLVDPSHGVRSAGLQLLGELSADGGGELLATLQVAVRDVDHRVRHAALSALLTLQQRRQQLPLRVVALATRALEDDFADVRTAGLRLLWALACAHPDATVPAVATSGSVAAGSAAAGSSAASEGNQARLVDEVFVTICNSVCDAEPEVRTTACSLLGSLRGVGVPYLLQTFDKRLMSHLRPRKSAHQQMKERHKRAAAVMASLASNPDGDIDVKDMSLSNAGAAGAFVHGLEDEFSEVRHAAVDAICELSLDCSQLAHAALDFLVDMFNDEIDAVRLNAIHSLRKINTHVVLREEQLDIVLGSLEDRQRIIREGMHRLLGSATMGDSPCLQVAIQALLISIQRNSSDTLSIWRTLRDLGASHHIYAEFLVAPLLGIDSQFAQPEPPVDDPVYIGKCLFLAAAAARNRNILPLLPDYFDRHYRYLLDRFPDLFPANALAKSGAPAALAISSGAAAFATGTPSGAAVSSGSATSAVASAGSTANPAPAAAASASSNPSSGSGAVAGSGMASGGALVSAAAASATRRDREVGRTWLRTARARVRAAREAVARGDFEEARKQMRYGNHDLRQVGLYSAQLRWSADFLQQYVQWLHAYCKYLQASQAAIVPVVPDMTALLAPLDAMDNLFCGLPQTLRNRLLLLRVVTNALLAKDHMSTGGAAAIDISFVPLLHHALQQDRGWPPGVADLLRRCLQLLQQSLDLAGASGSGAAAVGIDGGSSDSLDVVLGSLAALGASLPAFDGEEGLRRVSASIQHPASGIIHPTAAFKAGFPHEVVLHAVIENLDDLADLRLQIVYPDLSIRIVMPDAKDLQHLGGQRYQLRTRIWLTNSAWSRPGTVHVTVARVVAVRGISASDAMPTEHLAVRRKPRSTTAGLMAISAPAQLEIQPKH